MRAKQLVTVEVTDSDPAVKFMSRVEGVAPDHLILAGPRGRIDPAALAQGQGVRVTLFHNGGAHAFDTRVIEYQAGEQPKLTVQRPTQLEAMQRRQFFRERALIQTLCNTREGGGFEVEGVTRNLGGGGVCIRTVETEDLRRLLDNLESGEPVWLEIGLPDSPLQVLGSVVWMTMDDDGRHAEIGLEFLDLPEAERERLIRYLFVLQREALRKGF